jgi:hypothetical protein
VSAAPSFADVFFAFDRGITSFHRTLDRPELDLRLRLLHQKLPIALGFSRDTDSVYSKPHLSWPTPFGA